MPRRLIGTMWDRITRNDINKNFEELYNDVGNFSEKVTDDVMDEIRNNVNLIWKSTVDSTNELPSDAETGETRMVNDDEEKGVYRYDGSEWIKIQEFNPDAIDAVETRLENKINEKETPEDAQDKADNALAESKDYTDVLEDRVFDEGGEVVKVVEKGGNSSDGYYTRWSDGRQEVVMSITQLANIEEGSLYMSEVDNVNFPKSFDSSYPIRAACHVSSVNRWANAITTTNSNYMTVCQYSTRKATSSFTTRIIAIGRWK